MMYLIYGLVTHDFNSLGADWELCMFNWRIMPMAGFRNYYITLALPCNKIFFILPCNANLRVQFSWRVSLYLILTYSILPCIILKWLLFSVVTYACTIASSWLLTYSETCTRWSLLGPDQLVVIEWWPAYKDYIENELILHVSRSTIVLRDRAGSKWPPLHKVQ